VKRRSRNDSLSRVLQETQEMVGRLVQENRTLRAQNQRLARQADKMADGWEQIKKLVRSAPKGRARR
jgi:cell division protein FtsB